MENLIVAVNCVIPVFICLAVGYIAKMRRVIPEGTYPYINRFSFTVLLSVQMFHNVYSAEFNRAFSPRLIAYLLGATLFIYITAGLIFRHAVKDPRTRGAYWQDAYRTNVAIVGIALMEVPLPTRSNFSPRILRNSSRSTLLARIFCSSVNGIYGTLSPP